jgi:hypothetical protein
MDIQPVILSVIYHNALGKTLKIEPLAKENIHANTANFSSWNLKQKQETRQALINITHDFQAKCSITAVNELTERKVSIITSKIAEEDLPYDPEIQTFDFSNYRITARTLNIFSKFFPNVESIILSEVHNLSASHLNVLQYFKKLSHLDLSGCRNLKNEALLYLKAPNLSVLKLTGCFKLEDEALNCLPQFSHLQVLNLGGCFYITDKGLSHLQTLQQLKDLSLAGCTEITDQSLEYIKNLKLTALNLAGCVDITDNGLASLQAMDSLVSLNLAYYNKITDKGLTYLQGLQNLKHLSLEGHIFKITDEGLAFLHTIENLEVLNVARCRYLTLGGLEPLLNALPNLKQIMLDLSKPGTRMSLDDVWQLQAHFPAINIQLLSSERVAGSNDYGFDERIGKYNHQK